MTWLAHAGPSASGADGGGAGPGIVLAGPGAEPARSASRINGVLTAVRGMVVHAVSTGNPRADQVRATEEVLRHMERFIQAHPEQWHVPHRIWSGSP